MNDIGIMQGRLSPAPSGPAQCFPWTRWREEFQLARTCGFTSIEWLVSSDSPQENPLWTERGVAGIQDVIAEAGVGVPSVCLDCFIGAPLVHASQNERAERVATLEHLIYQSASLGAAVALLPLLEGNAPERAEDVDELLRVLARPLALAKGLGIMLALETDLPAKDTIGLIRRAGSGPLGVYFDTGNAAAVGHDVPAEIRALAPYLCGVHIKDRARGGPNVLLGQGSVPFAECFAALAAAHYRGPLILETGRGAHPVTSAQANLSFVTRELAAVPGRSRC